MLWCFAQCWKKCKELGLCNFVALTYSFLITEGNQGSWFPIPLAKMNCHLNLLILNHCTKSGLMLEVKKNSHQMNQWKVDEGSESKFKYDLSEITNYKCNQRQGDRNFQRGKHLFLSYLTFSSLSHFLFPYLILRRKTLSEKWNVLYGRSARQLQ